jgi:carbon-monoxide dehydrogenase medium subunit
VDDAVRLLGENPNARPLAGGQTLVNVMKARAAAPDVLVDLNGLEELRTISVSPDGGLELGAMATYAALLRSPEVQSTRPVVAEVAGMIADVQVRNRGTVGGNVCTGDPTNHFPPLMVALGATMTVRGSGGERQVPAEEFFIGVYMTAAGPGELLTRISIPAPDGQADGFSLVAIGKDGTPIVSAAACVRANGSIQSVRVALGCVDAVPVRLGALESRLAGSGSAESELREAAKGAGSELDPPSDVHAGADYRRHLAEIVAARAVSRAVKGGRT